MATPWAAAPLSATQREQLAALYSGPAPVQRLLLATPPFGGGRATALAAAGVLLCPAGGCGTCASCRMVATGVHPDLLTVSPVRGTVPMEAVKNAVTAAYTAGYQGRKVLLLERLEQAGHGSFQPLLKVLEEPPAHLFVIVTTEKESALPPTILSRMQLFRVAPLPAADAAAVLMANGAAPDDQLLADSLGRYGLARLFIDGTLPQAALARVRSALLQVVRYGYTPTAVLQLCKEIQTLLKDDDISEHKATVADYLAVLFDTVADQQADQAAALRLRQAGLALYGHLQNNGNASLATWAALSPLAPAVA